ncbi:hypothetical protein GobsT_18220 [Gemmata obscuriglobus]|nr:hypothetical protein GobsT_18220 [Gemmata obscuriglobus]VTS03500.1 unnamed protein product [Gemmata obscuriglobus UQM 2246]
MSEFKLGTLTNQPHKTEGRSVTCTVPVDRPPALIVGG